MKHADDMQNPITDEFARDLYCGGLDRDLPAIVGVPGLKFEPWEHALPETRDAFRDRARRFMAGDLSVLPWTWPISLPTAMRRLGPVIRVETA